MSERLEERHATFKRVEEIYQRFYEALQLDGMLPYRSTESGMWAVSDAREVYHAFSHFQLGQYHHMADLGSGDGKVALIGSLFTRVTGYETDEVLYNKSVEIRDELGLSNASFQLRDYLLADLSSYDILYLYPDKPFYDLEEKLRSVWQGHLIVNGPHFPPRHLIKLTEAPPSVGKFVLYESSC
ncbi:MAG: hypothetical protein PVG64_09240 [Syntrophobacterales bacterium]|jgi:hypothetical protein